MKLKPKIREATPTDIPGITEIYKVEVETETASFELTAPDEAEMLSRFGKITASGKPYLVAEIGGKIAGYAYCSEYRARPAYRFTVENSVYVARWARKIGVARMLMETLIDHATKAGFRQMIAVIGGNDNLGSIALHRAVGFHDVGTLKAVGFKFGRWHDTVLMQLELGEGGRTAAG